MLFDIHNIIFKELNAGWLDEKKISVSVARLDKIHPVVSGNKLFKLHYFLEKYQSGQFKKIQTFGGAYSNHLVATAFACAQLHIPCTGIIRGEETSTLSHTLQQCIGYGMQLQFISRPAYARTSGLPQNAGNTLVIPEGGYHPLGAKGASLIMETIPANTTHTCLPVGTATTLAGILQKAAADQNIIAIPVLKGFTDMNERLQLLNGENNYSNLSIWDQYHFGGYAKKTPGLLEFMNKLYREHQLPTDFVYTAKMMYAVFEAITNNVFDPGSKIVCLHTGGLQGNESLPAGSLIF